MNMNILRKKVIFALFSIIVLFCISNFVYAESEPTFYTSAATSITDTSAYLNGDFYSESIDRFPLIWFQYGVDSNNLDKVTEDIVETKKNFTYSKSISGLKPETKYYFRTVLEINSDIYYGNILSFVTLTSNIDNNIHDVSYGNGSANNELNRMINEYDASLRQGYNNTDTDKNKSNIVGDGSFSFFDFFRNLFKKENDNKNSDLVHTEEEIKQAELERQNRLEKLSEQKRYNNSASEDDEFGEVVKYNRNNNYVVNNNKHTTNVIIFLILLVIVVFVIYKTYSLSKNRRYKYRENLSNIRSSNSNNDGERYYIPIKRDLHDPIQNPNPEADIDNRDDKFLGWKK